MSQVEVKRSFKVVFTGIFSAILTAGFLFNVSFALIPDFGFSISGLFGEYYLNVKGLTIYAIVFYALWATYKRNEQYHVKKHLEKQK
ncbi:hypothetical protein [Pseudoalteromonas agarivorans]|uniref:Uncharacterized protein n=1 Tax=Pseudoalteromonas agarivorans TaxID=176102 RepID=A0AAD0U1Y9_9GAMM|nr:hypothetical protein [Pseudoalteromonas agarivorans]AYM86610.1 hypothetical protein D9T18_07765 [Pseudoalteromonas agarivorans]